MYEKEEDYLLGVIEDLHLLADQQSNNGTHLSAMEATQDYASLSKQIELLQTELQRAEDVYQKRMQTEDENKVFASPTARAMSDEYSNTLNEYLVVARDKLQILTKKKTLLKTKLRSLMEYFGEDVNCSDNLPIFNAIKEFRKALAFSKESIEWKIRQQNPMN